MLREQTRRQQRRETEAVRERAAAFTPFERVCAKNGCEKVIRIGYYNRTQKFCCKMCAKKDRRPRSRAARLRNNPAFRAKTRISSRIREVLKRRGLKKDAPTIRYLGCTTEHFRSHIEAQFDSRMSWDNYGPRGWHVDHIIPMAAFDVRNPTHVDLCSNYKNLRPLWWDENEQKADRVDVGLVDSTFLKQLVGAGVIEV